MKISKFNVYYRELEILKGRLNRRNKYAIITSVL
jgi:hypothetical protein